MNTVEIITKKRDGYQLTQNEIEYFIKGTVSREIPDYQVSALLMAIYFKGMTEEETFYLTRAMMESGDVVDLSEIKGFKVDKHSTGGVGDKLTIISCPIAAAAGVKIAKMSGRGLGFTGGTIDKLMAVPGFSTDIPLDQFKSNVNEKGISLIAQVQNLDNADKILYALRDVTGTVESMPLIVSSIMSKKLALGADGIILDVKYGNGALMKTYEKAEEMAKKMKRIGEYFGKKMEYVLSPMAEPLGSQVGNANEVIEAIELLKGNAKPDLWEEAINLAGRMIHLSGIGESIQGSIELAEYLVQSGKALETFKCWIESQGGNPKVVDDYSLLPGHRYTEKVIGADLGVAEKRQLKAVDALTVGEASGLSGAGRMKKDDILDLGAGITVLCKGGSTVLPETVVFEVYGNDKDKVMQAKEKLLSACQWQ